MVRFWGASRPATLVYPVIKWLVSKNEIIVGLTDSCRWQCDIEDGDSGANARTMVSATLRISSTRVVDEEIGFFPRDDLRTLSLQTIPRLLKYRLELKRRRSHESTSLRATWQATRDVISTKLRTGDALSL